MVKTIISSGSRDRAGHFVGSSGAHLPVLDFFEPFAPHGPLDVPVIVTPPLLTARNKKQ